MVVARCTVAYQGRLATVLPDAVRLILCKADGSLSIHSEAGYKPLNWMSAPCVITELDGAWRVENRAGEALLITLTEVLHDSRHELGADPGLVKDGVEAQLQQLLAEQCHLLGAGLELVRREYPTSIGPVDLLCRDRVGGGHVAVEVKRRADLDAVEQLCRYVELLHRDTLLGGVRGLLVAQEIKPQAKVLAVDRGLRWQVVDYDDLRGAQSTIPRLF